MIQPEAAPRSRPGHLYSALLGLNPSMLLLCTTDDSGSQWFLLTQAASVVMSSIQPEWMNDIFKIIFSRDEMRN